LATRLVTVRLVPPPPLANESVEGLAGVGSEIVVSFRLFPYLPLRSQLTARIIDDLGYVSDVVFVPGADRRKPGSYCQL